MFITKKTMTLILALPFIFANLLFSNSVSLNDNGDGTWDLDYISDDAIGGFQFDVEGASINGASGGDAAASGFMLSTSATTVLGFSLTGATIDAGEGTLLVLDLEGTPTGLANLVVSDPAGQALDFTYDDGSDDELACLDDCDSESYLPADEDGIAANNMHDWCNWLIYIDSVNCLNDCNDDINMMFTDLQSMCDACPDANQVDSWDIDGNCLSGDDGGDDGGEGVIGDEPNSLWLIDNGDSWSIGFNSSNDIGGFQLNIDGASINGASGGEAAGAGFMLSTSATTVLGFSLSGGTISAQDGGILIDLDLDGVPSGISGIVVSDPGGSDLGFTYDDGSVTVYCEDMNACNYNQEGDCLYAEENYDCDGNCIVGEDCAGECGGSAVEDECGVCDGSGPDFQCWDGSVECAVSDCPEQPADLIELSFMNVDTGSGLLDVYMTNTAPVAGFQIELSGLNITGASGGSAADAGFTVSTGSSTLLGFSLTGAAIPAGEGVLLLSVAFDSPGSDICFVDAVISDASGSAIDTNLGDCYSGVPGCMDMSACNYNMDATYDDGSCAYDFDCAGECGGSTVEDCNGECGGPAVEDCAGVCDGVAEYDCAGVCEGFAVEDACGVCEGSETDPLNCIQEGFSLGFGTVDLENGTLEILMNNESDIAGFQFNVEGLSISSASGGLAADYGFSVSASGTTVVGFSLTGAVIPPSNGVLVNLAFDSATAGEEFCISNAILSDPLANSYDVEVGDCFNGFGCTDISACNYDENAVVDDGSCEYESDCAGECGGSAVVDDCGVCDGGNADQDCFGVCFGMFYVFGLVSHTDVLKHTLWRFG